MDPAERAQITIFDTTLRDGEQAPGCSMGIKDKLRLAHQLDRLGVDVIEGGFPVSSEEEFQAVCRVAAEVHRPIIAALSRANIADIDRAWGALAGAKRPRIHIVLATSDLHLQSKLKITREQGIAQVHETISHARSLCDDVEFSPEDATRSDIDYLCQVLDTAIAAGATVLNIPDTVGYAIPDEFGGMIRTIRQRVKGIETVTISVHCHNDLGLAVANTLAAVRAGARQVECTINGIGERAGNCSLEEIVMLFAVRQAQLPYKTGISTPQIYPTSCLLAEIVGFEPQPNKAIVGRNAFAHEAGIHQHGVMSNPLCYEIMAPESVGVQGNDLVLGKHSGRHALGKRLAELGYGVSADELESLYFQFKKLTETKKRVYDQDLISMASSLARRETAWAAS